MMRRRFRFTIGGQMAAVAAAAVGSALMAWAIRAAPADDMARWFVLSIVPMLGLLGFDAYLLARRARAGRPPFGTGRPRATFVPQLILVLLCLYLPFAWVLGEEPRRHGWLAMGAVLPGFGVMIPLHRLVHQRTVFEGPVVALTTALLIMGLVRLVARDHGPWACGLALLAAVPSSLLAHAAYAF